MLTVNNLTYKIGTQEILSNVQTEFHQGRMTAIVGPNGSGKSTLLSFLSRDKPSTGKVFLEGKDISTISPQDYARMVAVLPQQRETIADFFVKDVVIMGRFPYKEGFRDYTEEDRLIAAQAMEQAGVSRMAHRRISHMSGGEIQRVMIAKTLAQRAQLVLLDEPTNHLDVKYKLAAVQGKIEKLPKKKIFVYDASDGKPFTAFKGYTTNILKLIGAENVMENAGVDKTWAAVSWENVVAANPEYIIIADYSNGIRNDDDFQQKVAAIKNNPQLAGITAVKENHFVKVKLSEITPGVRTVDALVRMAEEIHGISVK